MTEIKKTGKTDCGVRLWRAFNTRLMSLNANLWAKGSHDVIDLKLFVAFSYHVKKFHLCLISLFMRVVFFFRFLYILITVILMSLFDNFNISVVLRSDYVDSFIP